MWRCGDVAMWRCGDVALHRHITSPHHIATSHRHITSPHYIATLHRHIATSHITSPHRQINKSPLVLSLNYLATRFTCSWPWSIAVMLCDGRVVCGCADPYATRVLGDMRATTLNAIWQGPVASALRSDLNQGGSTFCGD